VLKRRHAYVLLFAVPALLASIVAAALMLAAAAGFLWLFVLGDNPWPHAAGTGLGMVFILGGAGLWVGLLAIAFAVGKRQEFRPTLNTAHVVLAIGMTVLLAAAIGMRMMGLNVFGTRSDSLVCADLCRAEGFAASGTPPQNSGDRTCSCYDGQGQEAKRIPLGSPFE
jgi:hypothetical protein